MTRPKIRYFIYDVAADTVALNIIFWEAFVHGLIANDEKKQNKTKKQKQKTNNNNNKTKKTNKKNKKKHIANSRLEYKTHTLFMIKMAKIDTLFMTKTAEKPYPLGPHIPI